MELGFPIPHLLHPMPWHLTLQPLAKPLRIVARLLFPQSDLLSSLGTIAVSLLSRETKKLNISATMHEKWDEEPSTGRDFSMPAYRYSEFMGDRI